MSGVEAACQSCESPTNRKNEEGDSHPDNLKTLNYISGDASANNSNPSDIIFTSHGKEVYRIKNNKPNKLVEVGDDYTFDDKGRFAFLSGFEVTSGNLKLKATESVAGGGEPDQKEGNQDLEKASNYALVGGTMSATVDVAMEKGIGAEEELGALGKTASKYMKGLGYVAAGVAALQTMEDIRNGNTRMAVIHGLDAAMGVVGTLGPIGAGVSIVWGFSRAFWGN